MSRTLGESDVELPMNRNWSDTLSDFTRRNRWLLAALWLVLMIICGVSAISLNKSLSTGGWFVPGSGTEIVEHELTSGFVGRGDTTASLVVHDRLNSAGSPEFAERANTVYEDVARDPRLQVSSSFGWSTVSPTARAQFVGEDGRTVITSLGLDVDRDTATRTFPELQREYSEKYSAQNLDVTVLSSPLFWGEVNEQSTLGLVKAELITFPIILLIALLLFRSVVAAVSALLVGGTAIVLTTGILAQIAKHVEFSIFIENIATMLGLGVGIDYSLFVIKRFREELRATGDVSQAVAVSMRTAGHTVIASGVTIVVAMSTLFFVRLNAIVSMAVGAIAVVAVSVCVVVVFLPVLLHILGHRIDLGRVPIPQRFQRPETPTDAEIPERWWYRTTKRVMARPIAYLAGATVVMGVLAVPAAGMQLYDPDWRILPSSSDVHTGFERVADQYGPGAATPIQVVLRSDRPFDESGASAAVTGFVESLEANDRVATVSSAVRVLKLVSPTDPLALLAPETMRALPEDVRAGTGFYVSDDRRKFVVEIVSKYAPSDRQATELLTDVRDAAGKLPAEITATVGGETSYGVDANREIERGLPWVLALMLASTYVVLLLTFRSVFLPLKAILVNVLSVGATYGVLVMIFQHGWGANLLGIETSGYLTNFVPILLLAILFSLSTDYEVFLLSRVREEYSKTGDNERSVGVGMTRTAPLISGAALLMVAVFGAFGLAGILPVQQLGIGMAIAIALDATLVRIVIVPAAMKLLGDWNWWVPGSSRPKTDAHRVAHGDPH